jgi:23S rRNA pseudouridine1911/1915/1917 synthase
VHAKHLHHPVAGDPVYGFKKQKLGVDGQLLHAWQLTLSHPTTGEEMTFNAPLPPIFSDILKKLCLKYGVEEAQFKHILHKE